MSYKLICPNCDRYTSAVFHAYADGRPCPHCNEPLHDDDGRTARSYYAQLSGVDLILAYNETVESTGEARARILRERGTE